MRIGDNSGGGLPYIRPAAQGAEIASTLPGDSYQTLSGTGMATPVVSGMAALLFSAGANLNSDQVAHIIREGGTLAEMMARAENPPGEQEMLQAQAERILDTARQEGKSAQQVLDRFHPVNDTMPTLYESDEARDKLFQERIDERFQVAQTLQQMESAEGFQGKKSDWSDEGHVNLLEMDAIGKKRFYEELDAKNEAYYTQLITKLTQ